MKTFLSLLSYVWTYWAAEFTDTNSSQLNIRDVIENMP